jgi:hypothetical protein
MAIEKATLPYLTGATLKRLDGTEFKSELLWSEGKGAVVMSVRRPG